MAIDRKTIEATILAKGFYPVDITAYRNLSSLIKIKCKSDHTFFTDFKTVRKDNFKCPMCDGEMSSALEVHQGELPPKYGYRIVAIDQASHKIGISVFDNGKLVYYHYVEAEGTLSVRLVKVYRFLVETIIKQWQPDYLAFEGVQYQNNNPETHKILSMVLGICMLAAEQYKIEHGSVLNKVWQSEFNILGAGRDAQKANVIKKVKEMYDIEVVDDIADAILLGKYAAIRLQTRWQKVLF